MKKWDDFLDVVGNVYARGIFRIVRECQEDEPLHVNELSRITGYSVASIAKYVGIMENANILKRHPYEKKMNEKYEYVGTPVERIRTATVKILKISDTEEAELFGKILDKEIAF